MNGTLNKVMLIGRLGDNIKLTYFEGGNCIGRFPLATNEEYVNKATNEKVVETDWHTIVVRNKLAEVIEKYTTKGDLIYVEGRLKTRQWQAEDGSMRYTTEVYVTDVNLLPNRRENQNSPSSPSEGNFSKEDNGMPF
ncbi:single-stranded DNA-binding protein [Capnocytophaga cynodegmi]|uniref:single-stranded DNA-binding protein n=1 Tax=Capnocytophaga cynodegmi TaxID=28189 RepID=UPI001BB43D31|nr:single-stranded DNA-binding protein [Capnocytophaga cynodegmi]